MDILLTNIWRFFDPLLFGLVFSSVIVMAWVQNGRRSFQLAVAALLNAGRDPFADSGENATFMCRRVDFIMREHGLVGLETVRSEDAFATRILNQLVHVKDAKAYEEWARLEENAVKKKQDITASYWNSVSEIAPAIGLIGTIIGLIQLFATGIDPMAMGPAMSFTLLTSLYGLFISHIIAYPIYVRLHTRAQILGAYRAQVVQHAIAIARRELVTLGPIHFSPVKTAQAAR